MTDDEWALIADRMRLAWGSAMETDRLRLYREILGDIPAAAVGVVVDQFIRSDLVEPPPPGVLRARAERLGQVPPPPPPVLPPPSPKSPTERLISGEGVSTAEFRERSGPQPPFNRWALAGLLVPLIIGFGFFLAWSGTTNPDDPDRVGPPVLEMLLSGGFGLGLSIVGLRRARDGRLRGGGLAVAAIIVSAIVLLFGFGALGTYANDAAMARFPR